MTLNRTFFLLLVLSVLIAAFVNPVLTIASIATLLAMWFLVRNLEFGLLVLIFFFPYLGLVVDFGQFEIFRDAVYLKNINAPFVDLFGLVLFGAWVLHFLFRHSERLPAQAGSEESRAYKNGILRSLHSLRMTMKDAHFKSYLLFWLSGLISLWRVPVIHFSTSLKYFARPFTFFYLVFFVPVVSILTSQIRHPDPEPREGEGSRHNRDGRDSSAAGLRMTVLEKVLLVFFWTGLLSAFNGFLGLIFGAHEAFPRAMPFGFFGINPLGPNHNLLAETLIATAPAGLMLARNKKQETRNKNWIVWGMGFQWLVALLTFARSAWIAVAVQAILYFILTRHPERSEGSRTFLRGILRSLRSLRMTVVGISLLLALFFLATTFSETVRGSTLSRLDMARIAFFYFERTPILGQGVGTFLPTLWGTKAYLLEYGDPIEAHGIIFKLMFEQGIFGIVAFGIFAGSIIWGIARSLNQTVKSIHEPTRTVLIAALLIAAGTLTYQLFNTTYYTSKLWVPLAIAVAIARVYSRGSSSGSVADKSGSVHYPLKIH